MNPRQSSSELRTWLVEEALTTYKNRKQEFFDQLREAFGPSHPLISFMESVCCVERHECRIDTFFENQEGDEVVLETPIHFFVRSGNVQLLEFVRDFFPHHFPKAVNSLNSYGDSPIDIAIRSGDSESLDLLLEHANIDILEHAHWVLSNYTSELNELPNTPEKFRAILQLYATSGSLMLRLITLRAKKKIGQVLGDGDDEGI